MLDIFILPEKGKYNNTGSGEKCRQKPFLSVIISVCIGKMPFSVDFLRNA